MLKQRKNKSFKILDLILIGIIVILVLFIIYRIKVTLRYDWAWKIIPKYLFKFDENLGRYTASTIINGFMMTIKLSIWGIIIGTVLGVAMGILRVQTELFGKFFSRIYVELVRNIPPIVLVFIFYFFFSSQVLDQFGIEESIKSSGPQVQKLISILFIKPALFTEFLSAALTIALYEGAYITEIVRAGIESIPRGQWEASYALGLSRYRQFRHIILPQAMKNVLPPLSGQFISTIKDSAIVSVISIPELSFQGMQVMASTYASFETWIVVTGLYFLLTFSCSYLLNLLFLKIQSAD